MDSGICSRKEYAAAINEMLNSGKLTPIEATKRLSAAIDREMQKNPDEIRMSFIDACEDLLYIINTSDSPVSLPHSANKELGVKRRKRKSRVRIIKRASIAAGIAAVLVVAAFLLDPVLYREWLSGGSTEDEEQFRIVGNVIDPNLVTDGVAENYNDHEDFVTDDFDDVIAFFGFAPPMPAWIPDGWSFSQCICMYGVDKQWVTVMYESESADPIIYDIKVFDDIEAAALEVHQNQNEDPQTINGREVYILANVDFSLATWFEGNTSYSIYAHITYDDMVKIFESTE